MENISRKELIEQINTIRTSMIQTGLNKGLDSAETVTISQQLDKLLYTYQLLNISKR